MNKQIIAFAGRKRAGKTTLSAYLADHYNGTVISIADALKTLVCDLLDMESIEKLDYYKDNGTSWSFPKDTYASKWAKTICEQVFGDYTDIQYNEIVGLLSGIYTYNVREMLQFVGTNIIRKYNPNWHVNKMVEAISSAKTDLVCIDDVRFPNEREAIEKLGGTVFFVVRPDLTVDVSNHESEISLTWSEFEDNRIIINSFSKEFMCKQFDDALHAKSPLQTSAPIFKQYYTEINKCNEKFGYCGSKKTCYDGNSLNATEYNFVKHVLINNMRAHNGCIVLHPENKVEFDFYQQMLYGKSDPVCGVNTIVLWNPFIIENIKAWM